MDKRRVSVISVLVSWLVPAMLSAQFPVGSEFQVNTYTTGNQSISDVAADASGNFVVVWSSSQDGDSTGVFGQRFASTGGALGTEFQVNSYTTGYQGGPAVATDSDGDFVVVWTSSSQDGASFGVFGQRFASTGSALGSEFQVNTYTTGSQNFSNVATDASGNFVVVWASSPQDGDGYGVFAQRFASTGSALGSEFQVNTYTTTDQGGLFGLAPAGVAAADNGDFVVVWFSNSQDGDSGGVFGQRFASTGSALGSEFQVNTYTTGSQSISDVAADPGGDFVVVWTSGQDGDSGGVFGQRFASTGSALGSEFQVNTYTTGSQDFSSVATDASGDFVVIWASNQDGNGGGVVGQRFASTGSAFGTEFQVNTYTTSNQGGLFGRGRAAADNGDFVVVWASNSQDGSGYGVFGQRFGLTPPPTATPTSTPTDTTSPAPTDTPPPTQTPTSTPGSLCLATPQAGCRGAAKSLLKISNNSDDTRDKLLWKWIRGQSTEAAEFGHPTSATVTALCVYDFTGLILSAIIPPGPGWSPLNNAWKYDDPAAANAGIRKVKLKGSTTNSAKIVVLGRGMNLPDPAFSGTEPVTAQLVNSDTAICFTASYTGAQLKLTSNSIKGKAP